MIVFLYLGLAYAIGALIAMVMERTSISGLLMILAFFFVAMFYFTR